METLTIRERPPHPAPAPEPQSTRGTDDGEAFTADQDSKIRIITNNLHRLNDSIAEAVAAGLTVEIKRASRFHCGSGQWGDQIYLIVDRNG